MNEIEITIKGNVVGPVKTTTTRKGHHLAWFTVATAERIPDRVTGAWGEGPTAFVPVKCWGVLAENVADCVGKSLPVIVHGRLNQRSYDRDLGDRTLRTTVWEITAYAVGPDLSRGVARFQRTKSRAVERAEERSIALATGVDTAGPSADASAGGPSPAAPATGPSADAGPAGGPARSTGGTPGAHTSADGGAAGGPVPASSS